MKKQNILKKISLIVLSSIVTISEVLAAADANIRQEKYEIEPRQEQYINDPAYPKLTTEDAGKNPKNKTKKSSENVSVATVLFTSIGVLRTIFKTEELLSVLFGNPYFKLGMLMQLHDYYYDTTSPVRETLLSPKRTMLRALRSFQRMKDTDGEEEKSVPQENEFEMNSASEPCEQDSFQMSTSSQINDTAFGPDDMTCQKVDHSLFSKDL